MGRSDNLPRVSNTHRQRLTDHIVYFNELPFTKSGAVCVPAAGGFMVDRSLRFARRATAILAVPPARAGRP